MYSLRLGPINEISLANGHSSTSKGSIVSSGLLSYIWFQMVSIKFVVISWGTQGIGFPLLLAISFYLFPHPAQWREVLS